MPLGLAKQLLLNRSACHGRGGGTGRHSSAAVADGGRPMPGATTVHIV